MIRADAAEYLYILCTSGPKALPTVGMPQRLLVVPKILIISVFIILNPAQHLTGSESHPGNSRHGTGRDASTLHD